LLLENNCNQNNFKRSSFLLTFFSFNLTMDLCLGKILIMGRGKHDHCWKHVTRVKNGLKWICNMASTSSNPPEAVINRLYSTQDQGK